VPKYDPAEAFKAKGIPDHPVGIFDELMKHNLPTRVFQSCAEPSADGAIKGCPHWYDCTMSYKGLPVAEGGGPRNHCWERVKAPANGGGIVRNVQPCYWGISQQEVASLNKEILQPIADEGEDYEMHTTVPDPSGGRDNLGFFKWDKKVLRLKVPAFKRIDEQDEMVEHQLRASVIKRETERLRHEGPAKRLGITGGDTPLDKRVPRGSKSKEA